MYQEAEGLAHEESGKKKRRKWGRYERKHSLRGGHIDWYGVDESNIKVRIILGPKLFNELDDEAKSRDEGADLERRAARPCTRCEAARQPWTAPCARVPPSAREIATSADPLPDMAGIEWEGAGRRGEESPSPFERPHCSIARSISLQQSLTSDSPEEISPTR